jgi:hypothetical protein
MPKAKCGGAVVVPKGCAAAYSDEKRLSDPEHSVCQLAMAKRQCA